MKAIIIMQHMLNNDLLAPTKNQLKNYGHNIIELYDECVKISSFCGKIVTAFITTNITTCIN
jgi:hypothetical protein